MKRTKVIGVLMALVMAMTVASPMVLHQEKTVQATTKKSGKIKLNYKKKTIRVGQKVTLKLKHAKAKKVKWKSSNKKIATVKKGVVKGKRKGRVTITAKYRGKKYKAKIRIIKGKYIISKDDCWVDVSDTSIKQAQKMVDEMDQAKNIIVSPTSLNVVLGMVVNGADTKVQKEIETYLGKTKEEYNQEILKFMNRTGKETALNVHNSFWYKNLYQVQPDLENVLKNSYLSENQGIQMIQDDVKTINQWVSDKTDKMIPTILDGITADTVAIFINAILFKGEWTVPFEANNTYANTFTQFDGTKKKIPMMHGEESIYYENKKAIGFEKTYGKNKEYSFIAMLPKKEGAFTVKSLNPESFLQSRTDRYRVNVEMPKFTYDWSDEGVLNDYLKANGLPTMFDATVNPLGKIFVNCPENVYVSDVIQKCKIIVDEEGTKAAAVTAVIAKATAMLHPSVKRKTVKLNRPFAYMIVDNQSGEILFMGKMIQPK
ncbi:MAG: serpin family protein [Eubacterium sp.]|nr:serpin family protein [Eubacterium sp.]